jgi:endoglucanase
LFGSSGISVSGKIHISFLIAPKVFPMYPVSKLIVGCAPTSLLIRTMLVLSVALTASCGGGGSSASGETAAVPATQTPATPAPVAVSPTELPAVPTGAAPGASAKAMATAKALGRGVNLGNIFEAPNEGEWGVTYSEDLATKASQAGFKSVRLPVRWSNHALAASPYTIDTVFMERVAGVVDQLIAKGFYVVLNMHHYRQLDGDNRDPNEFAVASADVDKRMVMMWQQIANRFKNHSDQLVFELYNEPHGRLNGEPWNALLARALGQVRPSNPDRAVVIGPTFWNNVSDLPKLKLPNDANLIVTVHQYEPFNFTHQGAEWISTPPPPTGIFCCDDSQKGKITGILNTAQEWSTRNKYPIYIGEFGAYGAGGRAPETSRVSFNRFMRDEAERRNMSWSYWEFAAGFGVYDPVAKTFRQALLDSLVK